MPQGDGTGPRGEGPRTGRKGGTTSNQGSGAGGGRGPGGSCICPSCRAKSSHKAGSPCFEQKCPECGTTMTRE